jgi:hypothetical protein
VADAHPRTAAVEAQRGFNAELALSNSARFAVALAAKGAPSAVREEDRAAMSRTIAALRAAPCDEDRTTVLASRLAVSVEHYATARRRRLSDPVGDDEIAAATGGDFTPAVALDSGWLPGSTPISTEASITAGTACSTAPQCRRTCALSHSAQGCGDVR